jgi:alginate O-acetyltransferase complex protein AlgI
MVFSSNLFLLLFLPLFLIAYYLTPQRFRNYTALTASLFFYSWGGPLFVFVVLSSIVVDFYIVQMMYSAEHKRKQWLLGISVFLNVGLLAYFKYANFFVENVNGIIEGFGGEPVPWLKVALPIGISFFTFQKLSYTIDIYRNVHGPLKKVSDYALYILLFPQLIAGPIVRFGEIADRIEDRRKWETIDNKLTGFFRFVIGLSKKVLISNPLGEYSKEIFEMGYYELTTPLAWMGAIAFAFQIYFDFAGYSDMAIGIGKMLGFKFPENFNSPYISQNITEFWRRWHITLGRWMRDYLYIPLGGNKVSPKRMYFNLWVVFLISGLWHGAAWNFIAWGAFHGFFLIADRLFLLKFTTAIGKWPSIIFTFVITLFGWVIFNASDMAAALNYMQHMVEFDFSSNDMIFYNDFWIISAIAIFFSFLTAFSFGLRLERNVFESVYSLKGTVAMYAICMLLLLICVSSINTSDFNPFIYFRF